MTCATNKFLVPLDPFDDIDYTYDWSDFLINEGDQISTFTITLPQAAIDAGLEKHDQVKIDITKIIDDEEVIFPNTGVKVWFKVNALNQADAGWAPPGKEYAIKCTITTTSNRIKSKSPFLRVKNS